MNKKKVSVITACIVIGGFLWVRFSLRRAVRYVIPQGYSGWVRVEYSTANAPALPLEDGYVLAVIPPSGLLKTATPLEERWAADQYYQIDGHGKKRLLIADNDDDASMIWNESTNGPKLKFFCGTKQQLSQDENPASGIRN